VAVKELFWLSNYNKSPEVLKELNGLPERIKIYDTTLRDGEQVVGLSLDVDEKVKIAQALAEAGVDRIEAGFASSSPGDKMAVAKIRQEVRGADIWGFARCNPNDVKDVLETGVRSLVCEIATSPHKMKAWSLDQATILKRIRESISFAKKEGLYVAYFAVDATRADPDFLRQCYQCAVEECGADEIVVVDTLGVATPEAMYHLTKKVKTWVKVPVAVHCHNDFGLSVACTIAALKAGADSAHVTVNGLGEKTGNCDIAELAIALHGLYDIQTNLKLEKLYGLSKLVERITKIPVSYQKPVVGELSFARESGLVVAQMLSYAPSVEGYDPMAVGREREVVLGKKSGTKSIEYALDQIGIDNMSAETVAELLVLVKQEGMSRKGPVPLEDFKKLAAKLQ
jgi:isopropylmalate/homocitrate/citramalate synthase